MSAFVVAVDGPGGVGKSTVSRLVAEEIGAAHLDTGAFYRAAAVAVLDDGADATSAEEVMAAWGSRRVEQRAGRTFLDGRDVSERIRSDEVNAIVSQVAAHPPLRAEMVAAQQAWVRQRQGPAVVEGRDIGTVVFPDALVKVFLDADPAVRAARRAGESGGETAGVAEALERRDHIDSTRAVSPLVAAADAVVVDTSELSITEVVGAVVALVEARRP